ncbi:MAG: hypothetical protein FWF41_07505 [Betaproteobacteria bacterium]|nr:hypothetical protein [Betaproteobacteria bacterium]
MSKLITGSILELPDLLVDSCVTDESCNLIFGSIWGRDTAIQEILGKITLNPSDPLSLRSIMIEGDGIHSPVYFEKDFLDKKLAKCYPGTLFGAMNHLWLFDKRILEPDYANHSAYLIHQNDAIVDERVWRMVSDLSPYPLPDNWQAEVIKVVSTFDMLTPMKTVLGKVGCFKLSLNVDLIQQTVSGLIRTGKLTISQA